MFVGCFQRAIYDAGCPLLPNVNLRFLLGEDGDIDRLASDKLFSESPPLEDDLRLVSARMSSRLTLRSEDTGATEVSRISVNLEVAILWDGWEKKMHSGNGISGQE
jgi:hypothetical protein